MRPNDICLAHFPFGGTVGRKLRPVLVLTAPVGPVPEVLVAFISSVIPNTLLPTDIVFDPRRPEHAGTRLSAVSILRLHKLATIHRLDVTRQLGRISAATATDVAGKLRTLLKL